MVKYSDEYKRLGTAIAKQYIAQGYVGRNKRGYVEVCPGGGVTYGIAYEVAVSALAVEGMKATDVPEVVACMKKRIDNGGNGSEKYGLLDNFYTGAKEYVGKEIRRLYVGEPFVKKEKQVVERWVVKNVNPNRDYLHSYKQVDGSIVHGDLFWLRGAYSIKFDGHCTDELAKATWYLREEDALWGVKVMDDAITHGRLFKHAVEGSLYNEYAALIYSEEYAKYAPQYKAVKVEIVIKEV